MFRAEAFLARQAALRWGLAAAGLDALVVSSLPNVTYLTGLEASAALALFTAEQGWIVSDGRYAQALEARAMAMPGWHP